MRILSGVIYMVEWCYLHGIILDPPHEKSSLHADLVHFDLANFKDATSAPPQAPSFLYV